ncbi:MAG: preprotein translocase subunit SecE [Candidatus Harrisonbacteria bacterium CG10_big_fil_rev_8_21_14_0_10_49_15]|uniref:Protein translocase subunit SecE n=1 Tax=Candidatus Harrisonbacteria bacterium CG10_big_fil_rev_8_21_14_0_10_49_15 TaxID=1974587 RepID=A0A2H0ULY2_9BACT|nr:MAG: preprotein translocase subunit SecE [Candidatus Harrisonbacteria bacterium CG10_big_fil_rev_8_21_14_0_10_49_15]
MLENIKNYFIGARKEFKAITWPSTAETRQLTTIVIALAVAFAFFLGVFDYLFTYLLEQLVFTLI